MRIDHKKISTLKIIEKPPNELNVNKKKSTPPAPQRLKKLFLIDGVGALVSAISLGVVLVQLEAYFGIPKSTLYFLAALPVLFAIYDFYCFFRINENLGKYLKGIAYVNCGYCILSIGLAIYHSSSITNLGWIYIILELIIVLVIVIIEFNATKTD